MGACRRIDIRQTGRVPERLRRDDDAVALNSRNRWGDAVVPARLLSWQLPGPRKKTFAFSLQEQHAAPLAVGILDHASFTLEGRPFTFPLLLPYTI